MMHTVSRFRSALILTLLLITVSQAKEPAAIVPGVTRLTGSTKTDAIRRGQILLGELNCIHCHKPTAAWQSILHQRTPPLLDHVGGRIRHGYLAHFLADPQAAKPGTLMPDVLAGLNEHEKKEVLTALTHLLGSMGMVQDERPDRKLAAEGRVVYHRVGCVACHGSRDAAGNPDKALPNSVPLGDLKSKYTLTSLRVFLDNPHAVRPSGRMPGLLQGDENRQVANYLLQGAAYDRMPPNMTYTYYEGSWDRLPDFKKLRPVASGQASDFDLSVAHRVNDMALRFEGWFRIDHDGEYRFYLTSDDGSQLLIDDRLIVDNDGIHAPTRRAGNTRLTRGMHRLVASVFNAGGGVELGLEFEGPGIDRQAVSPRITLTRNPTPNKPKPDADHFPIDPGLVAKGRQLFRSLGCANCHDLTTGGKHLDALLTAPALDHLQAEGGCLAAERHRGVPHFALSSQQRSDLQAALLAAPTGSLRPKEVITRTLATFNCYACHVRDGIGGAPTALNSFFKTVQPEMGDEGRVPPPLDGVGAKLNADYLRHILNDGEKDRPYMYTRMPRFGEANTPGLVQALAAVDPVPTEPKVSFHLSPPRVKAMARHMVSGASMGCVKCHTFAGHAAEGIQAMDMVRMPQRLRHGWFYHYLLNPQKYRPGTRMPSAWPDGETPFPKLLDGSAAKQIEAIWQYLSDGDRAQVPPGMDKQSIVLVPDKEAILYRGFIDGAGPRGIAAGYPEKAHLAFDANDLRLAMLWQGAFFDAARHWTDRGEGWVGPLGDNVLHLPTGVSFAFLDKATADWPTQSARELPGYRFRGYRLTRDGRPTFMYSVGAVQIEDRPHALTARKDDAAAMRRVLTLTSTASATHLWFRAAKGRTIEKLNNGWYRIDSEWKMHLETPSTPVIHGAAGAMELRIPMRFENGHARIAQTFVW